MAHIVAREATEAIAATQRAQNSAIHRPLTPAVLVSQSKSSSPTSLDNKDTKKNESRLPQNTSDESRVEPKSNADIEVTDTGVTMNCQSERPTQEELQKYFEAGSSLVYMAGSGNNDEARSVR